MNPAKPKNRSAPFTHKKSSQPKMFFHNTNPQPSLKPIQYKRKTKVQCIHSNLQNQESKIAKPNDKEFSVLVSNAGDWTSRQIRTGPTKLWVRGVPACGVLRIAPLFKSIVLVATGSGIGPCLPVIYAKKVPIRIFWSTPHPEANFGPEVIQAIRDADPNAVIHNTKTMGRPDMVAITYRLLRESGAEAVAIISNKKLTQLVVYAMESRGIPAYGAIFDS